jgi:hypothetical protein
LASLDPGRKEKFSGSVPEISFQRFHSRSSDPKVQVVPVQKFWRFWRFWSKVPEVLVQMFRWFWSKSFGFGPKVPEVMVQKFRRFWSRSSGGPGLKVRKF